MDPDRSGCMRGEGIAANAGDRKGVMAHVQVV
jgi:hypothetical protein